MRVEIRCYGDVRAAVGSDRATVELDAGATVADALDALAASAPDLDAGATDDLVVMRDRRHLDRDAALRDGDTVSVSGSPMPE